MTPWPPYLLKLFLLLTQITPDINSKLLLQGPTLKVKENEYMFAYFTNIPLEDP